MKVYDALAGKLGLAPSRILSRDETLAAIPTLETDGLTGGVIYYDGQFDDSRLAVNLAQIPVRMNSHLQCSLDAGQYRAEQLRYTVDSRTPCRGIAGTRNSRPRLPHHSPTQRSLCAVKERYHRGTTTKAMDS